MAQLGRSAVATAVRAVRSKNAAPRKVAISLTPSAVQKVRELLKENTTAVGLRVGVRTRGCNGLSYTLEYAQEKGKLDEEVIQDGARILIDAKAQMTLLGTEMDYISNKLSSEFVFHNPNITGTCGCGESFTV